MTAPLKDLLVERYLFSRTRGDQYFKNPDHETILHVLIGTVGVASSFGVWEHVGQRQVVFDGPPAALYLPRGAEFRIWAESPVAEVVVASYPVEELRLPHLVQPGDVKVHQIGRDFWQREVYEVMGGAGPAVRLRCGETVNPPGRWSSWPMHREEKNPENAAQFEELFFVFHDPVSPDLPDGETCLRRRGTFPDGTSVDDLVLLGNGASIAVPMGYHPICAPLTATLKYVWFYAAPWAKQYAVSAEHGGRYA